ncbi:MAG TPA: hypothetical protein VHM01_03375 [Alphaproteobacteria bacterium]|nr:hypothetical protein [Alphaproteobacteria bacterium]
MRSESKISIAGDEIVVRVSAMELERSARAYRARVIGELLADAIIWATRLPRRLAESFESAGRRQRV